MDIVHVPGGIANCDEKMKQKLRAAEGNFMGRRGVVVVIGGTQHVDRAGLQLDALRVLICLKALITSPRF